MSEDVATPQSEEHPAAATVEVHAPLGHAGGPQSPKQRKRRAPTPAEVSLIRWLAAKARPVTMGPIGHCVKRGWCEPVRGIIDDHDGRRIGFIYTVTEAGLLVIREESQQQIAADRQYPLAPDRTEAERFHPFHRDLIVTDKKRKICDPSRCPDWPVVDDRPIEGRRGRRSRPA